MTATTDTNYQRSHPTFLRRVRQIVIGTPLVGVVIILASAFYFWLQHNQKAILPKPTGNYAVGRVGYDWVDMTRQDTLGQNKNAYRELMVWVWYPALPASGSQPAEYLPDHWRQAIEDRMGLGSIFAAQNLVDVQVHAIADAPLAPNGQPYPVLIMQPGLGLIATDYTTLAEELASQGYIVVASTPTYSASVVVFQDGRVVEQSASGKPPDNASSQEANTILNSLVNVWTTDNIFVMDQLEKLNTADPSGKFTGHLDLQAIGFWGHSLGGASAAQTCHLDNRCKAGVNIDGTLYGDVVQTGLQQPFMFIWSQPANPSNTNRQQSIHQGQTIYDQLKNGGYQIMINGTAHLNFSDEALFYELMGGFGPIDGQRGLRITSDYLDAFFNKYLKGVESPLLEGASSSYPEVQFQSR